MQLDAIPVHAPGVISRLMDGEAVLVHPAQGKVRVLNRVGARIWELVDGSRDLAAVAEAIAAEYDISPERAQADVSAFCEDLVSRGVMVVRG
ncbi:MAG: PqqD family protein [Anaerolineae bacterium]|nr:PqqD family protein [Anaerolineae bacterium]